jgi:UDP-N-acetylglucosamine--N-acetylmuramyl-(pentapeptide) pyrophosphoryl-undecaprenol N-acetylglucosamine transferase
MAIRVMVMAGGTGGHVYPALAVADELRRRGCLVSWLGVPDSFEARVIPQHGIPIDWIDAFRLRGQGLMSLGLAPGRLVRVLYQAWRVLRRRNPQVLLGMGGFVAAPGGSVGWLLGKPLVVHEQNAIPGLANRWLARVATRVMAAFPDSFPTNCHSEVVGNPVRHEIAQLAEPDERLADRQGRCRLLILGGSLGAAALNETLPLALALLPTASRPLVRHQAGRGKLDATRAAYHAAQVEAEVSDFLEDVAGAYAWADLVVCRAGALTVSELAMVGLGAVLVPYPQAVDDHQTKNAEHLVRAGAAERIAQVDLTPVLLAHALQRLCGDRGRLLKMARAARALAQPQATQRVAEVCLEVAQ